MRLKIWDCQDIKRQGPNENRWKESPRASGKAAVLRPLFRGTALQVAQGSVKEDAAAHVSPKE